MTDITHIVRESKIVLTPRVLLMRGVFDVPPSEVIREEWNVGLELPAEWNVGLIVGPSGSGKTTIINEMFHDFICPDWPWDESKSVLDSFPKKMSIKEIVDLLSSVGFSSPPSWVKPYHVLSNGEKFRVNLARTIAEMPEMSVIDEYSSVVDRTVAQVGSAALQRAVRKNNSKLIAVSCHYDIVDWLEPDWVYQPHINELVVGRSLYHRPEVILEIRRVYPSAWTMFRKYHYLNTDLNKSATCFCAFWNGVPVAFTAVLHFPHPVVKNVRREHRTVCLPDYQGIGIGNAMSDFVGSICRGMGYRFISETSNPAMINHRNRSQNWIMKQPPTIDRPMGGPNTQRRSWMDQPRKRLVASFEYVGKSLDRETATRLWNGE